ncbi:alpha/beta hydrolase [Dermatobacter hominis]|uniref:alpha/beta hydrolase n=1 Tax=Dermatobacter hominis TaxID=2884263 RepID=UPI001D0FF96B|nr:alpha/beta hydrolase [Dermatobacter hominis]UDY36014.1 alpha/beta hydrolase [Dermatobacter hominis]
MPSSAPRTGRRGAARRGRRTLPAVAALAVTLLVAVGCAGDDGTALPRMSSGDRPAETSDVPSTTTIPDGLPATWQPAPLEWATCPPSDGRDLSAARCATLAVPLDWADPAGPTIDLELARLPATGGADERIGTLLTNPGGPGGSGVDFIAADPFGGSLSRRFDQVSWDPRGVGRSTAVRCGSDTASAFLAADPDPDTPTEQQELDRLAAAVSSECASSDAALLAHIGTVDVARDMEAIRLALGDGALNYVGFSYGTQIGQHYAEMFPDRVRAMVLDGVVDPALGFTDFLMGQIDGFDASFERSVAGCRTNARRCGVVDLAAAYDQVREQVEQAPLPAGPGRTLGPAELAVAAVYTGYADDGWKRLGPALADALDGDGTALVELSDRYHDLGGYGAYAGVVCTDTPPPASSAEWQRFSDAARARSPRFGGSVANELLPCATWPVRSDAVPAPLTAPGAPPILVIGNTGDPATPLANAEAVASHLASGVLVTADISGHTAYGVDACVTDLVDAYLTTLAVPPDGTRCGG